LTAAGLTQHYDVSTAAGYQASSDKPIIVGLGAERCGAVPVITRRPGAPGRRPLPDRILDLSG
jgi:hypothetical protein